MTRSQIQVRSVDLQHVGTILAISVVAWLDGWNCECQLNGSTAVTQSGHHVPNYLCLPLPKVPSYWNHFGGLEAKEGVAAVKKVSAVKKVFEGENYRVTQGDVQLPTQEWCKVSSRPLPACRKVTIQI